jgi:hypothetical protein
MSKTTNSDVLVDIRIGFLGCVADWIVSQMGTRTIDLGDPKERKRLAGWLREALTISLLSWERGAEAITKKAVSRLLRILRDPAFAEVLDVYMEVLQEERAAGSLRKQEVGRAAKIERWERQSLNVSKATIQ